MKRMEVFIDFEKKQFLEPILSFLDADLSAMREVYNLSLTDKKERGTVVIKHEHLANLPAVQARVKGLGDPNIYEKFRSFSHKRVKIGNAIETQGKDPYIELESAIEIAGELMGLVFKRVREISN